jgi:hypothetical protein
VKEDETARACSTHGEEEECIQGFVGKQEGKSLLGRYILRSKDNIKIDFREIEWGGMD